MEVAKAASLGVQELSAVVEVAKAAAADVSG